VTPQPRTAPIVVDCLEYSNPSRERFLEWHAGGVGCIHATLAIWEDARDTLRVIGKWNRLFDEHADLVAPARTADEIREVAASGRTAIVFGFQNTSPFEDNIEFVEVFHQLGVRIAQLTYNTQNHIAAGCWESEEQGLSKFYGQNLIREMNRCGMLVDLSHCNERTSYDVLDISTRPVAITHANPAEFVGPDIELNRRNKSSRLLKALADAGGVLGLSMYPKISRADCTLAEFCDMVAWTVELIGIDAVGLGSDFYDGYDRSEIFWWRAGRWSRESAVPLTPQGFSVWPDWFPNPTGFPGLLEGLTARGFNEEEVAKIAGENWLRIFDESFSREHGVTSRGVPTAAVGSAVG
jgi:microsomal dipeptidase-like Zn-dependent dipeptidase